jgi:Ras-related protein Rab-2A
MIILAGNKCDKEELRQVSFQEASEFAKVHELFFLEVSAKTGFNVDKLFDLSAGKVLEKIESGEMDLKDESCGIKIGTYSGNKSSEKGKYIKVTDRNGENQQLIDVSRFNKRKCCK